MALVLVARLFNDQRPGFATEATQVRVDMPLCLAGSLRLEARGKERGAFGTRSPLHPLLTAPTPAGEAEHDAKPPKIRGSFIRAATREVAATASSG